MCSWSSSWLSSVCRSCCSFWLRASGLDYGLRFDANLYLIAFAYLSLESGLNSVHNFVQDSNLNLALVARC